MSSDPRHWLGGLPQETLYELRLAECAVCPHLIRGRLGPRCGKCHCFVKLKAKIPTQSCPESRWPF